MRTLWSLILLFLVLSLAACQAPVPTGPLPRIEDRALVSDQLPFPWCEDEYFLDGQHCVLWATPDHTKGYVLEVTKPQDSATYAVWAKLYYDGRMMEYITDAQGFDTEASMTVGQTRIELTVKHGALFVTPMFPSDYQLFEVDSCLTPERPNIMAVWDVIHAQEILDQAEKENRAMGVMTQNAGFAYEPPGENAWHFFVNGEKMGLLQYSDWGSTTISHDLLATAGDSFTFYHPLSDTEALYVPVLHCGHGFYAWGARTGSRGPLK